MITRILASKLTAALSFEVAACAVCGAKFADGKARSSRRAHPRDCRAKGGLKRPAIYQALPSGSRRDDLRIRPFSRSRATPLRVVEPRARARSLRRSEQPLPGVAAALAGVGRHPADGGPAHHQPGSPLRLGRRPPAVVVRDPDRWSLRARRHPPRRRRDGLDAARLVGLRRPGQPLTGVYRALVPAALDRPGLGAARSLAAAARPLPGDVGRPRVPAHAPRRAGLPDRRRGRAVAAR